MDPKPAVAIGAGVLLVSLWLVVPAAAAPTCFGQDATITGTNDDNVLYGTPGDDVIVAGDGNDRVFARAGDDLVCGKRGNDRLRGGEGADKISGGRGNDVPFTSNRDEVVRGGLFGNRGDDVIRGGAGMDRLQGGRGQDVLKGGASSDNHVFVAGIDSTGHSPAGGGYHASWEGGLFGGGGADLLFGGRSEDLLDARDGVRWNDRLDGGAADHDSCRSDPDREVGCES